MKKEFTPFLASVIPSIFAMATLNPEMSIQGVEKAGDLIDVLSEVKPADKAEGDKTNKFSITTDEIEEKDVAIQMLAVFIDELGGGFAEFVEPTSRVLLTLINYEANDSIRNSVAGALPGLVKCVKENNPANTELLVNMGKTYMDALWKAVQNETETDTLICQVQAIKEVIDEIGTPFLSQETVDALYKQLVDMYYTSNQRINENNELAKNDDKEDEDDEIDQDELEVIKEENKNEHDLQLSIAEIIGIIFKTHGTLSTGIVQNLFETLLTESLQSQEKQKNKFALFIMDDMVEYLGPEILGPFYTNVAAQIIKFCSSSVAALRQAASYGIGVMAKNGGAAFASVVNDCLQGLKQAIDYQMPASIKEKKAKVKQFNHAKDNAVSALGKVIRYQTQCLDAQAIIPGWLNLLPIKHDVEEAKIQNEILSSLLNDAPLVLLGDQYQRLEQVVVILGEVLDKKFVEIETGVKLATFLKQLATDANLGLHFKTIYDNKLTPESKARIEKAIASLQ